MKRALITGGSGGGAPREDIELFKAWKNFCSIKCVSLSKNVLIEGCGFINIFLIFQKSSYLRGGLLNRGFLFHDHR